MEKHIFNEAYVGQTKFTKELEEKVTDIKTVFELIKPTIQGKKKIFSISEQESKAANMVINQLASFLKKSLNLTSCNIRIGGDKVWGANAAMFPIISDEKLKKDIAKKIGKKPNPNLNTKMLYDLCDVTYDSSFGVYKFKTDEHKYCCLLLGINLIVELTVQEIVAVILHELGHFFEIIFYKGKRAIHNYHSAMFAQYVGELVTGTGFFSLLGKKTINKVYAIRYKTDLEKANISEKDSLEEIMYKLAKFDDVLEKDIPQEQKSTILDFVRKEVSTGKMEEEFEKYNKRFIPDEDVKKKMSFFDYLLFLLIAILTFKIGVVSATIIAIFALPIALSHINYKARGKNFGGRDSERIADSMAIVYGYSTYLDTGLKKLMYISGADIALIGTLDELFHWVPLVNIGSALQTVGKMAITEILDSNYNGTLSRIRTMRNILEVDLEKNRKDLNKDLIKAMEFEIQSLKDSEAEFIRSHKNFFVRFFLNLYKKGYLDKDKKIMNRDEIKRDIIDIYDEVQKN